MLPFEYWLIVLITAIAVVACVSLHYEGLRFIDRLPMTKIGNRHKIVVMILCILLLHVGEIWIFGLLYYGLMVDGDFGRFEGIYDGTIFDSVYFSATVFTTLGFGDIVPHGPVRFVVGTESVAGLTLITWSASFTFVELSKIREQERDRDRQ